MNLTLKWLVDGAYGIELFSVSNNTGISVQLKYGVYKMKEGGMNW